MLEGLGESGSAFNGIFLVSSMSTKPLGLPIVLVSVSKLLPFSRVIVAEFSGCWGLEGRSIFLFHRRNIRVVALFGPLHSAFHASYSGWVLLVEISKNPSSTPITPRVPAGMHGLSDRHRKSHL
ncbi:hypothetical protein Salat_2564300 [Sesamum alatum]|uniref:Uncharacterized protein n=1 Tax=Sesamum alatum TaxID=300844 RepID=A0AAE1XTK9_9LAMI|nr:hypothetical protein Salat_2564300 [Sesamum alatum]